MKNFAEKFDSNHPKTKEHFENVDNLRFFLTRVFLWNAIYMLLTYICITFLATNSVAIQIVGGLLNKSPYFFFVNLAMSFICLAALFVSNMFRKSPIHSGFAFFTFYFCSFCVFLRTVGTPSFKLYFDAVIFLAFVYSGLYFYIAVLHAKTAFKFFDLFGYVIFVTVIIFFCYNQYSVRKNEYRVYSALVALVYGISHIYFL